MVFKVKRNKEKEIKLKSDVLRIGYQRLDNEAEEQFGNSFSQLTLKEQKKISKKVAGQ